MRTERRPTLGETLGGTLAGSAHGDRFPSEVLMVSGCEHCCVGVCTCVWGVWWPEAKRKGGCV